MAGKEDWPFRCSVMLRCVPLMRRSLSASVASRVHAISDEARKFYLAIGFTECPHEPMTLVVTLRDIRAVPGV
jgi:hypothetical protein